jgi:hypothetical protein
VRPAIFHSVVYNCCLTAGCGGLEFVRIGNCDTAFITKQMLCLLGLFIVVHYHVHL